MQRFLRIPQKLEEDGGDRPNQQPTSSDPTADPCFVLGVEEPGEEDGVGRVEKTRYLVHPFEICLGGGTIRNP